MVSLSIRTEISKAVNLFRNDILTMFIIMMIIIRMTLFLNFKLKIHFSWDFIVWMRILSTLNIQSVEF